MTVTVTNPGNQTGTKGTPASLTSSASGGTGSYTWSVTLSAGSLVGCTVAVGLPTSTQATREESATFFDNCFGTDESGHALFPFAHTAQKLYFQAGHFPTTFVDGGGKTVASLVAAGCQMWLCYQPKTDGSDLAALTASVQYWINNHPHGAAGIRVILFQEAQNASWGFTSSTYAAIYPLYAPGIHALRDHTGQAPKIVYDASGHAPTEWVPWGNAIINNGSTTDYLDEVVVDFYGAGDWVNQTTSGTTNLDPLSPIRVWALGYGYNFGLGEVGSAIVPATITNTLAEQYITYCITMMSAIPADQRTAVMWYDGLANSPNINTISSSSDYRISFNDPITGHPSGLKVLWNALAPVQQLPPGIGVSSSTGTMSGTPTATGTYDVTIIAKDTSGATGSASFVWTIDAPAGNTVTVTDPGSQAGTVGTPLSLPISAGDSASGQTLTYTASSLPPGLTINSSSGTISGTPTTAGSYLPTVTATDTTSASGSVSFAWVISTPSVGNTVTVTSPGNQTTTAGVLVGVSFLAVDSDSSETIAWTASGLPPGITMGSGTGVCYGTPTTPGTYSVTATATDPTGAFGTGTLTWTIVEPEEVVGSDLVIEPSDYAGFLYGTGLYGELGYTPPPSYLIEPFLARSLNYTSIGVSWTKPTGTAARWRLLSNRYGYPVDQNDGAILIDTPEWLGEFYLDTSVIQGSYHYYGLYALINPSTDQWQRCGVTACLATANFATVTSLLGNLPVYFTDYLNGDLTTDATGNSYLQQFLGVLAWGLDYVKTQAAMLASHLNDPMAIPIGDLMNLATELGMQFDPMVSVYLMRKAALNWAHIMQQRGTISGITGELELATGFGVDLQVGPNLMLENDQSQFTDPVYPDYDPSIKYASGERVGYGDYWYSCAIAGTKGTAPTGTNTSNANWNVLLDSDEPTGLLTNPVTGGINTWEVIYPGVTNGAPLANSIREGIGVPNPTNSVQWNFNSLKVKNLGGSAQDVVARSVSRTTADMGTTTTNWLPDPVQAIHDGIPVPWVLSTQVWDESIRYGTGDIVSYNGLPFIALRASTGATPPEDLVPTTEWAGLSPNLRLPLMVSGYTSQSLTTSSNETAAVTPFVDWFDQWGNFIARCYARTPSPPGIPDQLAFDSFTQAPASTIAGRGFDNEYAYTWTAADGDFDITGYAGGVAYPKVTGTRSIALTTGPSDGQVGVTFVTPATGGEVQEIVFRYSDDTDYWAATPTVLRKKVSGSWTTVATYTTAAQPGDRLVVQMSGSSIAVLLNGTSVATATDSFNVTATSHGFGVE